MDYNLEDLISQHFSNQPDQNIFYRLYYDDNGVPICYSMQEQEGNYIEIDADIYAESRYDVLVKDGKIIQIHQFNNTTKLVPSKTGTSCHPKDMMLVDQQSETRWEPKTYYDY